MVMLLFWLFCVLFFVENKVYIDNFEIFDFIDTFIVILLAPHFIFFMKYYSQQSILSLKFMYLMLPSLNIFTSNGSGFTGGVCPMPLPEYEPT